MGTGDGGCGRRPGRERPEPQRAARQAAADRPDARAAATRRPRSNPFSGGAGATRSTPLGLRNPYRFSFDSAHGDICDRRRRPGRLGGDRPRRPRGSSPGRTSAGTCSRAPTPSTATATPPSNYRPPVLEYSRRTGGNCAVTGGYVVRDREPAGARRPLPLRRLLRRRVLRSFDPHRPRARATPPPASRLDQPSSFGEGARRTDLRHLAHRRACPGSPSADAPRVGRRAPAGYRPRPTARPSEEDDLRWSPRPSRRRPRRPPATAPRTASPTATETFEVHRPVDGSVIRELADRLARATSPPTVAPACAPTQPAWEAIGFAGRRRWLEALRDWILANQDRLDRPHAGGDRQGPRRRDARGLLLPARRSTSGSTRGRSSSPTRSSRPTTRC